MTNSFLKNIVLVGCGEAWKALRTLIVLPIIAKLLGAAGYGVWSQIKVTTALIAPVAVLGLDEAFLRFVAGETQPERIRRCLSSTLTVVCAANALIAAVAFAAPVSLARVIFNQPELSGLVQLLAGFVCVESVNQIALIYQKTFLQMAAHLGFIIAEALVEIALVVGLVLAGQGLGVVLATLLAGRSAVLAVKLGWILSRVGLARPSAEVLRPFVAFGLPLVFGNLAYFLMNYGDRFLITAMLGIREVGVYAVAYAVGSLLFLLITPIQYVLYPMLAALWNQGRKPEMERLASSGLKYALVITMPVLAVCVMLPTQIVEAISSREFLPGAPAVPLIGLGFLLFGIGVIADRILLLANRARLVSGLYGMMAIVNIAMNVLLIPRVGIMGAAWSTCLTFGLFTICSVAWCRRYVPFGVPSILVLKLLGASAVSALPLRYMPLEGAWRLFVALLLDAALYSGLLVALRCFSRDELAAVLDVGRWAFGRRVMKPSQAL